MATQADVDALIMAIASNVAEVRFSDGRSVKYRSIGEMRDALGVLRQEMTTVPFNRTTLSSFSRA
jgi:hypothetical protein